MSTEPTEPGTGTPEQTAATPEQTAPEPAELPTGTAAPDPATADTTSGPTPDPTPGSGPTADDTDSDDENSGGSVLGAALGAVGALATGAASAAAQVLGGRKDEDDTTSEASTSDETPAVAPADETPADETPADETPAEVPAAEAPEAPAAEVTPEPQADTPADTPADAPAAEVTPEPQADAPAEAPAPDTTTPDATSPDATSPDAPDTTDAPAAPAPTPAALPRPGRGKRSRPAAPAPVAAVTPPLAVGAAAFGRVDDAGTVHVRDGDTEREVGQYPDVPVEEALAFYVRKFEDLAGQVHLLGQRLDNGTVPAKEARSSLVSLREQATDAKAVGDLPALRAELDRLDGLVAERTAAEDAQRAEARAKALAEREAIVVEAEQIAATPPASMHFKNAGERMAVLLDTWKTAQRSGTRLDKRTEDPLWKRFAAARSTVDRLRRAHFSQVSDQRAATKAEKEALITRAEELQTSTDWRSASDEYRTLMDRWKAAGRLARKDDDALWARFRAAQDVFFANRSAANSAQDEEYKGNLAVKEALLTEAEALLPVTDVAAAKKALASIQDRWDEAGRVPRSDLDRIEGRLRTVIEKVRDADSAKWGRSAPEVVARGSGLVAQLRQQVADLDAKVAEAEARGDSRTAQRAAKDRATKQAWLDQAEASLSDLSR